MKPNGKETLVPHLNNCVDLHPSHGTWARFLSGCNLMDTTCLDVDDGWSWYNSTNCHYFVRPDGTVRHNVFGYHARVMWNKLLRSLHECV